MVAPLEALPPELYSAILSHVPTAFLQQSVLSLTRAIPRSPVPIHHLFEHIRLKHGDQVSQLYLRLRRSPLDASWVQRFSLECWTVDADIVVNLIALIPQVLELSLYIGPNFAPEHLEEMFDKPRVSLKILSLRFRPYVQKATYYQFLKGAYFDSTLLAFSRWPAMDIPTISIVQDPLNPSMAPTKFAQPLVFFRLDPLSTLARSRVVANLLHLRLRIPSRQTARFLYTFPGALPSIESLDMSTCNIIESDVEGILGRFGRLKMLVLDGCYIVSHRADMQEQEAMGQWAALGKTMALAGVKFAREREKRLKSWLEAVYARSNASNDGIAAELEPARERRIRRGRRGLATATISLRDSPPETNVPIPTVLPSSQLPPPRGGQIPRIRILPSLPVLRSIATTPAAHLGPDKHEIIRTEFETGWAQGIAQLSATFGRLKQSWGNGMRVVQFDLDYRPGDKDGDGDDGLTGLKDVEDEQAFIINITGDDDSSANEEAGIEQGKCPILCLAGPGRSDVHVAGCAHQLGWDIWKDDL